MTEAAERPVQSQPRYHDGRSPAAWAGVLLGLVGFLVGSIGFLVGPGPDISPNWIVVGVGAVLVLLGCVSVLVLRAFGLGND